MLLVFTYDRIVYVENSAESTKHFLKTGNECSRVVGCTVNKKIQFYFYIEVSNWKLKLN